MTIPDQHTYSSGSGGWQQYPQQPQYYQPGQQRTSYENGYGTGYEASGYETPGYGTTGYATPGYGYETGYPGFQQTPPPRRRSGRAAAAVGGGILALAIAAGGGFAAGWSAHSTSTTASGSYLPLAPNSGTGNGSTGNGATGNGSTGSGSTGSGTSGTGATDAQVTAVATKVDGALVDINTVLGAENGEAAGTGIVLTSDGVILTNNHVVSGATSISVTDLGNNKTYQAAVVGYDRSDDVAVVKLKDASGLQTATLATSDTAKVGDSVVAIGNAGGTGGTPSAVGGSVTATNQSITASDESSGASEQLKGLIETDADIQAGDSGGPMLTTAGVVIGMDTAASAGFQMSGSQGYAIPIGSAMKIANAIRAGEASDTVHIGDTAELGIEVASQNNSGTTGATVYAVVQGTPAASAGLSRGDVITSVGGGSVDSATTLTNLLDRYHPGDKVKLSWTDTSGQSHSASVKLATGPVG